MKVGKLEAICLIHLPAMPKVIYRMNEHDIEVTGTITFSDIKSKKCKIYSKKWYELYL